MFVLDTGFHVFVWVGKDATPHEKGGGLVIAHVSSSTFDMTVVSLYNVHSYMLHSLYLCIALYPGASPVFA